MKLFNIHTFPMMFIHRSLVVISFGHTISSKHCTCKSNVFIVNVLQKVACLYTTWTYNCVFVHLTNTIIQKLKTHSSFYSVAQHLNLLISWPTSFICLMFAVRQLADTGFIRVGFADKGCLLRLKKNNSDEGGERDLNQQRWPAVKPKQKRRWKTLKPCF